MPERRTVGLHRCAALQILVLAVLLLFHRLLPFPLQHEAMVSGDVHVRVCVMVHGESGISGRLSSQPLLSHTCVMLVPGCCSAVCEQSPSFLPLSRRLQMGPHLLLRACEPALVVLLLQLQQFTGLLLPPRLL